MPKANSLAQRITDARARHGMSKSALAKAVGVTPAAVGAWEEGRASPRAPMLAAIAKVFGTEPEILATGGGKPARTAAPMPAPAPAAKPPAEPQRTPEQILADARSQLATIWKIDAGRVVITASLSTR